MTIKEDEEQLLHVLQEIVEACSVTRNVGVPDDFHAAADCTWTAPFTLSKGSGIESTGPRSGSVRHLPGAPHACGLALLRVNATINRQRSKEDALQEEPASKRAKAGQGGPRSLPALKYGLLVRKHSGACAPSEDLMQVLGPTVTRMLQPAISNSALVTSSTDTTARPSGSNSNGATTDTMGGGAACGGAVSAGNGLTAVGGAEGCGARGILGSDREDHPAMVARGSSDAADGKIDAIPDTANVATDAHEELTAQCPAPSVYAKGGEGGGSPMADDLPGVAAVPARCTRKRAGGAAGASSSMGAAGKSGQALHRRPRVWQEFTERTAGGGSWWIYLPCAVYQYKSEASNTTCSPAHAACPPAQHRLCGPSSIASGASLHVSGAHQAPIIATRTAAVGPPTSRVHSRCLEADNAVAAAPAGPDSPAEPADLHGQQHMEGYAMRRDDSIGGSASGCPVPQASWQPQEEGTGAAHIRSTALLHSGAPVPVTVLPTRNLPSHQPALLSDQLLVSRSCSVALAPAYRTTVAPIGMRAMAGDSMPGGCEGCNLPSSPPSSPLLWHDGIDAPCAVMSAPNQQVGSDWAANAESGQLGQLDQLMAAQWPGSCGTGLQTGTGVQAVPRAEAPGPQQNPDRWVRMPEPATTASTQLAPAVALRLPSSPPSSPLLVPIWADSPGSLGMPTPGAHMTDAGRLMDELMVELHGCHDAPCGSPHPHPQNPVLSTNPWDPAASAMPADRGAADRRILGSCASQPFTQQVQSERAVQVEPATCSDLLLPQYNQYSAILPGAGSWVSDNGLTRSVIPEPRIYPYQTQQTMRPMAGSAIAQLSRPAAPTPATWLPDVNPGQPAFEASHLQAVPAWHGTPQHYGVSECGRYAQRALLAAEQQPEPAYACTWSERQASEAVCHRSSQLQPCIPSDFAAMPAAAQPQPTLRAPESGLTADPAQMLDRTAAAAAPAGSLPWGSPTNGCGSGSHKATADTATHSAAPHGAITSSSTALLESLVQRLTLQPAPASAPDPASNPLWWDQLHPLYWDLLRGLVGVDTPQRSGADTLYDRCMELGLHPKGRGCYWHKYAVEPESKHQHGWTGRPLLVFIAWNWKNPEGSQWAPPGDPLCKARYAGHVSDVARAQQVHSLVEVAYRQGATREDVTAWVAAGRKALSHAVAARCVPVVEALLSHMGGLSAQDKMFAEPGGKWCVLHTACYKFKASRVCRETEEISARQERILDMLLRFWLDDFVSCARQAGRPDPEQSALDDLTLLAPTLIREGLKVSRKGRQVNPGLLVNAFRRLGVPVGIEEQSACALGSDPHSGAQPAHDRATTLQ